MVAFHWLMFQEKRDFKLASCSSLEVDFPTSWAAITTPTFAAFVRFAIGGAIFIWFAFQSQRMTTPKETSTAIAFVSLWRREGNNASIGIVVAFADRFGLFRWNSSHDRRQNNTGQKRNHIFRFGLRWRVWGTMKLLLSKTVGVIKVRRCTLRTFEAGARRE